MCHFELSLECAFGMNLKRELNIAKTEIRIVLLRCLEMRENEMLARMIVGGRCVGRYGSISCVQTQVWGMSVSEMTTSGETQLFNEESFFSVRYANAMLTHIHTQDYQTTLTHTKCP